MVLEGTFSTLSSLKAETLVEGPFDGSRTAYRFAIFVYRAPLGLQEVVIYQTNSLVAKQLQDIHPTSRYICS